MATASIRNAVAAALKEHKPVGSINYGTAGFRCIASKLVGVAFRVGVLAAVRSLNKGQFVGVMVTASHNPPCDNGIKFIDPDGGMLKTAWEPFIMEFMECSESDGASWLAGHLNNPETESIPRVLVGYDTRESSPQLAAEVKQGVEAMHGTCLFLNLVTTPQLHYAVYHMNQTTQHESPTKQPVSPDLDKIYVNRFTDRFCRGMDSLKLLKKSDSIQPILLNIDCANGIGSKVLGQFRRELAQRKCPVSFQLCNAQTKRRDWLNNSCGADYVKLNCKPPHLYDHEPGTYPLESGQRWATIDGDADRLLYFYILEEPEFTGEAGDVPRIVLLDGDRISCLFATFIKTLLEPSRKFTLGVIQTAYANAASTLYLQQKLSVPVVCVPTGVKHLHRAAQRFDFGIYFEANGHGTVLYSSAALDYVRSLDSDHPLAVFVGLTNTTIGDALTDILMVEYALAYLGWSLPDWAALYTEFASRQLKVPVERPHTIHTVDAERRVTCPLSLQNAIDEVVNTVRETTKQPDSSRAFVRPSGTENTVRVYAESVSQPLADWLATKVAICTHQIVCGISDPLPDPGPIPFP